MQLICKNALGSAQFGEAKRAGKDTMRIDFLDVISCCG